MKIRRKRYDVVFYLPSITPLLTDSARRPGGGAETQIVLLAQTLSRRGANVAVVAYPPDTGSTAPRLDGVDVFVRPAFMAHQRLIGKLQEVARIHYTLARIRSRAIVARVAGPQVGLVGLSAKLLRRKFIYSSANIFDFDFPALRFKRRDLTLYRLGLRAADAIVVQTDEQAALCEERLGLDSVVVRSVAETTERKGSPESFLWAGRLVWYKQPLAFVELARALPEARFRMVGVVTPESGGVPDEVRSAAAGLSNLELLEPRPRGELLELVDRAVAVVNTSYYEGMPNVFLEGWSRGIPALALHHDPDGVIGSRALGAFAEGSFERLVDDARELWGSRDDQAAVAERCRAYVASEHAISTVASRWERVLDIEARAESAQLRERTA